jgi:hypothetical protein
MPVLLYCVTLPGQTVSVTSGVCDSAVHSRELLQLRVYWSEIADTDECLRNPDSLKKAALKFHQVLRDILSSTTPIPFRFPALLESDEGIEEVVASEQELYRSALGRIGGSVQYEVVGNWAADPEADLATPVSGREYLKRRQEAAARIAAIDGKLRSVTAGLVREWRTRQDRKTHRWFALVARADRERFIASLRSAGPSQGMRLRVSGPWPPSEFVKAQVKNE